VPRKPPKGGTTNDFAVLLSCQAAVPKESHGAHRCDIKAGTLLSCKPLGSRNIGLAYSGVSTGFGLSVTKGMSSRSAESGVINGRL
jgi:hypothetical protein